MKTDPKVKQQLIRDEFINSTYAKYFPNMPKARQRWTVEDASFWENMLDAKVKGSFNPGIIIYDGSLKEPLPYVFAKNGLPKPLLRKINYAIKIIKFIDNNVPEDLLLSLSFSLGSKGTKFKDVIDTMLKNYSIADHWTILNVECFDGKMDTFCMVKAKHDVENITWTKGRKISE